MEDAFRADAVVVQCGVDLLGSDPLGMGNLTEKSLGDCITRILQLNLPTLFLGGGGYNLMNAAKCWTYLTSVIVGASISTEIPDHDVSFDFYKRIEISVLVTINLILQL